MKTIIEQGSNQDFIIISGSRVVKINQGKQVKYINEKDGIAEYIRFVNKVVFYEPEYAEGGLTGNAKRIELDKQNILSMADKIREIEGSIFEAIYEPDGDLPF